MTAPVEKLSNSELSRLRSLYSLDLLGQDGSRFDRFSSLARNALGVPVALVTLVDDDQQWFCAAEGTDLSGNARDASFCTVLVDEPLPMLIVADTRQDPRFSSLPIVVGEPFIRFYAGAPLRTGGGHRIGTLCVLDVQPKTMSESEVRVLRDLADLVERELEHVALAATDELTGLANRRAFVATATRFAVLGERHDQPVTVVFVDVDGLKTVNDSFGHIEGDALLRRAAVALSTAARAADLVARIGGDEFAICVFGQDDGQVTRMLADLDATIESANADVADGAAELSLSIGSCRLAANESVEDVLDRADREMYANRKRVRDSSQPRPS